MRTFTKLVAPALIATLALGTMVPVAQAQVHGQHNNSRYDNNGRHNAGRPTPVRNDNIRNELNGLNRDIDRAAARRTISSREATNLKREVSQVQRLYAQYARNGLTQSETRTLRNRVDRIQVALRAERRDNRRG